MHLSNGYERNPAQGEVSLADAQYRSILNTVRHGYIFRNIMNILTEYTIGGDMHRLHR
jgi:hypothetical protein